MSEEIKTPYSGTEHSDESFAARKSAEAEQKKKYMREAKRKSRKKEKEERQKQKAKEVEEGRQRLLRRQEEERIASGEKARADRVTLLTQELTDPNPMPTELLSDGTNYALYVQDEIDNFVADVCGENAPIESLYHKLSIHPLGQLLLQRASIKPLPELQEPYSYIATNEGIKVMHRPHGGVAEIWEPMPTANKNGGVYQPSATNYNVDASVFTASAAEADLIRQAKANKYERERIQKKEAYRQYLRGVEAKWKAWRAASRVKARETVS